MHGTALDDMHVEIDDATLTALAANEGRAWVEDSLGNMTSAAIVHDGTRYVLKLDHPLARRARGRQLISPADPTTRERTMTDLERDIFDRIEALFGKLAELQRQPEENALLGFQRAAHSIAAIEHRLTMANHEQARLFAELDHKLRS